MSGTVPADPGAIPEYIASILRTLLGSFAGFLLGKGVLTADQTAGFVAAGLFVLTVAWSLFQKAQARKRLNAAIAAPAGKATP